jgi:hypothetical protein
MAHHFLDGFHRRKLESGSDEIVTWIPSLECKLGHAFQNAIKLKRRQIGRRALERLEWAQKLAFPVGPLDETLCELLIFLEERLE